MRRHSRFPVAALFGLALLILIPSPAAVAQGGPPGVTDHFLCYEAIDRNPNAPIPISLDDQFCPAETPFCLNVSAMTALEFCNPTAKTVVGQDPTPIVEPDLHLTFYELTQKLPSARKRVAVTNQFNGGLEQILRVSAPRMIAVPTLKNGEVDDDADLEDINHFLCYEASGKRILVKADVQDQFRTDFETILVHAPQFLCNPATKRRGTEESPVPDPLDHLVCYKVTPSVNPPVSSVEANNQFEGLDLTDPEVFDIGPLHFLCVPSTKREL